MISMYGWKLSIEQASGDGKERESFPENTLALRTESGIGRISTIGAILVDARFPFILKGTETDRV